MNRPNQPIAEPEPGRPSQPIVEEPKRPKRLLRAAAIHDSDAEVKAEVEALIPGGAGTPYTELAAASGMDGDELQIVLDELAAAGKISQAVNNDVLCYVHL